MCCLLPSKRPTTGPTPERCRASLLRAGVLEVLVRALFADIGFTISVLVAVAITCGFAFIFEAPLPLVVSMLVLGLVTAILEQVMRQQQPP